MGRAICSVENCEREAHGKGWCLRHYNRWRQRGSVDAEVRQVLRGVPEVERFWAYVDSSGGPDACWIWTSATDPQFGYGRFTRTAVMKGAQAIGIGAHRYSYELAHGPIGSSSLFVCHHCDNPPCVNPAHLFLGTQSDNIRDMDSKGRRGGNQPKGEANARALLTDESVLELRRFQAAGGSVRGWAHRVGVSEEAAYLAANGRTWAHLNDVLIAGWEPRLTSKPRRKSRPAVGDGSEPWHGTVSGSSYRQCGCDRCRAAFTAYQRARKARGRKVS